MWWTFFRTVALALTAIALTFAAGGCAERSGDRPDGSQGLQVSRRGAAPSPATGFERITLSQPPTEAETRACADADGDVVRAGLLGQFHCRQALPDAGRACTGRQDCAGECLAPDTAPPGAPAAGACQAQTPLFGCYSVIEDGRATPPLCVD